MPSSKTTVYLREECAKVGIKGYYRMSNNEMIDKLIGCGVSINLPGKCEAAEGKKKSKAEGKKKSKAEGKKKSKAEGKNSGLLNLARNYHKLKEEQEAANSCKHKFEIIKPSNKSICVHCGEESTKKRLNRITKADLLRCNLYFQKD